MIRHDCGEILAYLHLAARGRARRRSGRVRKLRCRGGALGSRVHICAVVVADIDHVMPPLHSAGQRLKAYIVCPSVASEGDKFVIFLYLSLFLKNPVSGLHTGESGTRILKGIVDIAVLIGCIGIHEGGYFQTSGGIAHHSPVLRMQRPQHRPDRHRTAAARTHSVSRRKALRPAHHFFIIISCFHLISSHFL